MLPGPEAAEICMFFGCLVGGRLGGIVAGLGFILPGFLAMLLLSYLYTIVGLDNIYFNASFRALQPVVAAMVLKAVFKIGEHAFVSNKTKKFNHVLFILAILSALQSALRINYFITLGVFGIFYRYVPVSRTLAIWIRLVISMCQGKMLSRVQLLPFLFFPFCFTVCGLVAGDGPRESSCF